jgi:hypothetical protein
MGGCKKIIAQEPHLWKAENSRSNIHYLLLGLEGRAKEASYTGRKPDARVHPTDR